VKNENHCNLTKEFEALSSVKSPKIEFAQNQGINNLLNKRDFLFK
jgi:hypothetical protein